MPFQILSTSLGLADVVVRAATPHWLFAETANCGEVTSLLVYRSPMVRDDDPMYADVAALINRAAVAEEIYRGTVQDEGMMFGQGEWRVYLLHESSEPARLTDPRAIEAVNIIKGWGAPAHPVVAAGEMTNRLVH